MDTTKLDIGRVLGLSFENIGGWWLKALLLIAVYVVVGVLVEVNMAVAATTISNIVGFIVGVLATHAALTLRYGENYGGSLRFGAAFGLSLLTGIAILFAMILLIIPGIMLAVWWAVALPALLRENLGVTEAMERSKEMTAGNRWRIFGLMVVMFVPFMILIFALGGLYGVFSGFETEDTLGVIILTNVAAGLYTTFSPVCWVEAYGALGGEAARFEELEEVFA